MTFFSDSNPSIQDSMSLFPSLSKIYEPRGAPPLTSGHWVCSADSSRFSSRQCDEKNVVVRETLAAVCTTGRVELIGFEPTTPGLQSRCSPS